MEDGQSGQQTRVVIVNGQTIILQGDSGDNLEDIKINADLLQQALQEATDNLENQTNQEENSDEYTNLPLLGSEPFVIYEGEGGETQTIQLTAEQAHALGIQFTSDSDKNELSETHIDDDLQFKDSSPNMVYTEDAGQNEDEVMFDESQGTGNIQDSLEMEEGTDQFIETPQESLDVLLGSGNTNSNQHITLVPQFINGAIRYVVKLHDGLEESSEQFSELDVPTPVKDMTYSSVLQQPGVTFHNITSVATTSSPSVFTPINDPIPTTIQTVSNYQCSRTTPSHASLLLNKVAKPKQVGRIGQPPFVNTSTATIINTAQTSLPMKMQKKPAFSLLQNPPTTTTRIVAKPVAQAGMYKVSNSLSNSIVKRKPELLTPFFTKAPENVPSTTATTIPLTRPSPVLKTQNIAPTTLSSVVTTTGSKVIRVLGERGLKTYPSNVLVNTGSLKKPMTAEGKLVSGTVANMDNQKTMAGRCQALLTKKIPVAKFNKSKPLGSSQNPIQLVQHGQTFHSVQTLNQDQLKQIATVLQEKILDKPTRHNIIYNEETNTRIIYRVVYPEDLDAKDPRMKLITPAVRGRGKRGRPPKAARLGLGRGVPASDGSGVPMLLDGDEEDRLEDPTKGERKKVVARTRSGRVSRPPRHMVKDYKRLHRLDFEEPDLDDSDGGYSDYTPADQDNEDSQEPKSDENKLLPGLTSTRRKISSHFRCPTCQKIYLGHARMSRHFLAFPDHGSIDQLAMGGGDDKEEEEVKEPKKPATTSGRGRGKRRGPWAYCTPEARSARRKLKLREALTPCEADELSEVAGPAVAGVLSLWDLLLLRVDAVRTQESYVATLCDELGALLEKVKSIAGEILKPEVVGDHQSGVIELQDEAVCSALGVPCGRYLVEDRILKPIPIVFPNKRLKLDTESIGKTSKMLSIPSNDSDVLSALTLVAKHSDSEGKEDTRTEVISSPSKTIDRELLLPSDSEMCVATANGTNSSHDLQIVDEIVNERLKNLTGGNGLDYVLSVPIIINGSNSSGMKINSESPVSQLISLDSFQSNKIKPAWEKGTYNPETELVTIEDDEENCPESLNGLTVKMESSFGSTDMDYNSELAMEEMEEGDQPSEGSLQFSRNVESKSNFQGSDEEFVMLQEPTAVGDEEDGYDPGLALQAMESEGSQKFDQEPTAVGDEEDGYDPGLALQAMESEGSQKFEQERPDTEKQLENFDPDVSMMEDDDEIQFQNNTSVSDSSFNPEMALAAMGEGDQPETGGKTTIGQNNSLESSRTFPGLSLGDVSLDESGPELDFEALSEEFNRNTSHNS